MKITVERDRFAEAISSAMRAAGKANQIPILNNVLLKPNGAAVAIAGTNLTTWFETEVPAEIEGVSDEGVTILSEALSGIINRLPGGAQLSLEWDDPTKGANLKSGSSRYRLHTLPATDFPELAHPENPIRFTIASKDVLDALAVTKFAISRDKTRFYLNGTLMHVCHDDHAMFGSSPQKRLAFVATSGFEFARVSLPLPTDAADIPPVILPDVAVPEIVRLLTAVASDVQVFVSKNLVTIVVDGMTFTTKLINGYFPDYYQAIPGNSVGHMIIDVDELSSALQRLNSIDDAEMKMGSRTNCEMGDGSLRLTLVNHKLGDAEERIEIEWRGEPCKIGIRARGLLAVLDSVDADQCMINFTGDGHALMVNAYRSGKPDYTHTFATMPLSE